MAYKVALPPSAKIHNVFHISKLRKSLSGPLMQQAPLPSQFINTNLIPQPIAVLDSRMILQQGKSVL